MRAALRSVMAVTAGYLAAVVIGAKAALAFAFPAAFRGPDGTPRLPSLPWYGLSLLYSFTAPVAGVAEVMLGLFLSSRGGAA